MIRIDNEALEDYAINHAEKVMNNYKKNRVNDLENIEKFIKEEINSRVKYDYNFEKILSASYKTLVKIKKILDNINCDISGLNTIRNCYNNSFSSKEGLLQYDEKGRKTENYKLIDFVDQMDITVCPYCNRNYIETIKLSKDETRRLSQVDHFFPQAKYPLFAMSYFNLIPVCSSCNYWKMEDVLTLSPHDLQGDFMKTQIFEVIPQTVEGLFSKPDELKISLNTSITKLQGNIEILKLEEMYQSHKQEVHEVIWKKRVYSQSQIRELWNQYKDVFTSEAEIKAAIFGTDMTTKDFRRRSLAKLKYDVYKFIGN